MNHLFSRNNRRPGRGTPSCELEGTTGAYSKRACDNSMAAIKRALATYHGFQLIRLSKRVFNTLSIKFFVFSPHLDGRQQVNDKSLLRKRKNYNR